MRDSRRLELKPDEYRDAQAAERRKILAELLTMLQRARLNGDRWYTDALETVDRVRARRTRAPAEPVPEPDPDSPFQPPAPRRAPEPAEPQRLFG